MKYRLNKLTPKTTNHFKINDFEIELEKPMVKEISNYHIEGKELEKIKVKTIIKTKKLETKIGLDFPKYLEIKITIPENVRIKDPIQLTHSFQKEELLPTNIIIHYEKSSEANFIIKYDSIDSNIHWNYTRENISLEENAKGNITYWNNLNQNSINMIAFEGEIKDNSNLTHNLIDNGGNIRVYNADIDNKGYHAENIFNMIYIGKGNQKIDINYNFKNISKKSINRLTVEGVLSDYSKKNFRGIIDFKKESVDSIGEENENCVLLSNTCKSTSLPMLLCEEENVVGSHGESSGKVSKDKLFYLMSRGFSKKEAERFIVMANFNNIIKEIPNIQLQEEIKEIISNSI